VEKQYVNACMSPNIFNILNDEYRMQYPNNSQMFDAVSMSYTFITHFVNMINCIIFPCRGEDFSFVSIKSAAHWPGMESISDCGSVLSVAEFIVQAILSVSKQKIYWVLNRIAKGINK